MASDPRITAIERAVRETALKLFARKLSVDDVVAKLNVVCEMPIATAREAAAAERKILDDKMRAEMLRYERQGRGINAATLVAQAFAVDRFDDVEVETIARKLREWRKRKSVKPRPPQTLPAEAEKKNGGPPFFGEKLT
jgi:hypothetical protein